MIRYAHTRRFCSIIALVGLAACDRNAKDADPYSRIVREVVPGIESQTGLHFKTPPKIESRSKEEVRSFVMKQLSSERAQQEITGHQAAYRILGMIPDTMQLGGLMQRLLEEQIIGYYDPTTKVLYVVEGAPKDLLEQTVTHELVHALQDQYVNIDSIQGSIDDGDRQAAAQAVLEGQAVYEQLRLNSSTGPMLKMPGGWDRIRDAMRDGQSGMPVFGTAPRAVREGLLFPYLGGADFVRRFIERRPEKELLTDLPISTKQILNDDAYFETPRDLPTKVTIPAPRVGTQTYTNNFGEFEARLILNEYLKDEAIARRGAGGMDGDRFAVIRTPSGDALVWVTVWDSAIDAADFQDLLLDDVRKRYEMSRPDFEPGEADRSLSVPADAKRKRGARDVSALLTQSGTRHIVLFIDAPAGLGPRLIDPARITLSQ